MTTLYAHQKALIGQNPDKHLLAWETGVGKTLAAIKLAEGKGKVLVICPKSLTDNWANEIKKFSDPKNFIILSKENFRKMAGSIPRHDTIIIDEIHYFSGIKSQMSKRLYNYIERHKPTCIYGLTATPYMSTPWNIYALAKYFGRKWNYMAFKHKFFNDIRMGHRMIPVIKKGIEKDIAKLIQGLGSTVKLADCVDVPDNIFINEYFELTKEQKDAMENLEASVPISYWTKCHQICGGTLKSLSAVLPDKYYKSEKLSRVVDLCSEHDKIAIVCRYNAEIALISSKLKGKKPVHIIQGETKDKNKVVDKINKADKCIVLLQAACCEGYNMPGVPIMVFYSYDFSLKNYIQMRGRIQRINAVQKCVYISLIVKGSVDEDVYKSVVVKKQDFQAAIYAREKLSKKIQSVAGADLE